MRDSFIFYRSFFETIQKLNKRDRLSLVEAICNYALNDIEPECLTGTGDAVFTLLKPQLDANTRKYENGLKGGRPKETKQKPKQNQTISKPKRNVNDNDNVNDKRESIERKVAVAPALPRFVKPTIQEVAAYAASLQYRNFNAERFYAYYESNGWRVGKNPMKSWKGAVVNWHQREQEQPSVRKPVDNIHSIGDFTYERTTI